MARAKHFAVAYFSLLIRAPSMTLLKLEFEAWFRKCSLQNAAEVWLPIQRSQKKFEADFEPFDPEDNGWARFPSAGKNTTSVA
ncbi:hypothetical protein N7497_003700 [Penicillium chrysogenum]|nr:hypothetical protein N7497_003700 [Penicillium chrysogenum]